MNVIFIGNKVCISKVCGIVVFGFGMFFDKGFFYYKILKGIFFKYIWWGGLVSYVDVWFSYLFVCS